MKNSKEYLDKIVNIIEKPYNPELELYGIKDTVEKEYIMSKIFDELVKIFSYTFFSDFEIKINNNRDRIYSEQEDGVWFLYKYDSKGKEIYYTNSEGEWLETIYDEFGRPSSKKYYDGEIHHFIYGSLEVINYSGHIFHPSHNYELKVERWYGE